MAGNSSRQTEQCSVVRSLVSSARRSIHERSTSPDQRSDSEDFVDLVHRVRKDFRRPASSTGISEEERTTGSIWVQRQWSISKFEMFVIDLYKEKPLGQVGFLFANCQKNRRIHTISHCQSVGELIKAAGKGKILIIPKRDLNTPQEDERRTELNKVSEEDDRQPEEKEELERSAIGTKVDESDDVILLEDQPHTVRPQRRPLCLPARTTSYVTDHHWQSHSESDDSSSDLAFPPFPMIPPRSEPTASETDDVTSNSVDRNVEERDLQLRRQLIEEQDEAMLISLKSDQEKDRLKAVENALKEEEERNEARLNELRATRRRLLPSEPEDGLRIRVRTVNGQTTRRFHADTSSKVLHDFIGSLADATEFFEMNLPGNQIIASTSMVGTLKDLGIAVSTVLQVKWLNEVSSLEQTTTDRLDWVEADTPTVTFRQRRRAAEVAIGRVREWTRSRTSLPSSITNSHVHSDVESQLDNQDNQGNSVSTEAAGTLTVTEESQLSAVTNPGSSSRPQLIDLTSELIIGSENEINQFIPEVPTVGDNGQIPSTEVLKVRLTGHRQDFIQDDPEQSLLMEVRRGHVLTDALGIIRYSQDDLHNPLAINFLGEDGVDLGGVRREFWSLLLHNLMHSSYVTGKPGRLTFRANYVERKKRTFFHLGQLVALSIIQDGPGVPIFADIVTDYILSGQTTSVNVEDLPDGLKDVLEQMHDSREVQKLYSSINDHAFDAGFILPVTSFTVHYVAALKAALVEHMVSGCKDELNQFTEGLQTHQVLSLLQQPDYKEPARSLFSGRVQPVTVATLRKLLKFHYDDGNLGIGQQATGQGFLTFLQATKGTYTIQNEIRVEPKDVLMWLTGSTFMPAVGFHKLIDVHFGECTFINTCALCLTLKVEESMSPEDAVMHYTQLIINSQTFTRE